MQIAQFNSLRKITRHLIGFSRSLTLNQLRVLTQFLRHTLPHNRRVLRPGRVESISVSTWISKPPACAILAC